MCLLKKKDHYFDSEGTVEKCKSVFLSRLLKDEGGKVNVTVDFFSIGLHKK